jgi:hypothetical protein
MTRLSTMCQIHPSVSHCCPYTPTASAWRSRALLSAANPPRGGAHLRRDGGSAGPAKTGTPFSP